MKLGGILRCSGTEGDDEEEEGLLPGGGRRYDGVNRPVEGGRRDFVGSGSSSPRVSVSTVEVGSPVSSNLPSHSISRAS